MRKAMASILCLLLLWSCATAAEARAVTASPAAQAHDGERERLNDNVVTILSGNRDGDSLGVVYDLSEVLDNGDELRVLPVVGRGSAQNIRDVLLLRGIDMGITHSSILNHYAKTGELGDIKSRIAYVAKLFNEELHVLAGPGINSLDDLRGKTVNFGEAGSGTQLVSHLVFEALKLDVHEANLGQADAVKAIRDGRIAATILMTGKPSTFLADLKHTDGLKLIPIAFTDPLVADYYPAVLDHSDYPNLIPEGQQVETIASCAVIAVFNWPRDTARYRKVAKFVTAFFDHFDDFRAPPHRAKWRDVNFAATLEGWKRFPAAQAWIDNAKLRDAAKVDTAKSDAGASDPADAKDFDRFVDSKGKSLALQTAAEREELFRAFVKWKNSEGRN